MLSEKVSEYNIFQCQLCADKPEMPPTEFARHLREVHGWSGGIKVERTMTLHMDGKGWYGSVYRWTRDGQVFAVQNVHSAGKPR